MFGYLVASTVDWSGKVKFLVVWMIGYLVASTIDWLFWIGG
jgi:hypothetical protein